MTTEERLTQENAYLKLRNAQLQEEIIAVTADAERLRQTLERTHARRAERPNPLGGGQ